MKPKRGSGVWYYISSRAVWCGQKKPITISSFFFSISIWITILTQTCFTVINAFCVNLKHIAKGNQLDLSQKVVTSLEQIHGKIHIYIYIYIYILFVYVNNQIQQNNMQHAFFLATKSLSCSELIFPVSLAYYLSVCPVCSVLLHSDWFG